jgi:uncharacterized protein YdeI (YjbR/CyaY-like superfamily)
MKKKSAARSASKSKTKDALSAKLTKKSFRATLERLRSNLGWIIVWIPFDVYKTWGSRGNFRVHGEINGFPFRGALFPTRKGVHFLLVNKKMQKGSGALEGSTADFVLEPDTAERPIMVPPELQRHFAEDRAFRRWFDALSYSIRKWLTDLIHNSKNPATRERRAEQVAEQVFSAMEAERELPPAIKLAFSRDPRALAGWQLMTPIHRRNLLLAVFYYRSPDAQARRTEKIIAEAVALIEKKYST